MNDTKIREAEAPVRCLASGLDTLEIGYCLDLASSDIDFPELEYIKGRVRDGERAQEMVRLGCERFQMGASGAFPYRYVLRNDALTVCLAERMQPTTKVRFSSKSLWHDGAASLHKRVLTWADSISATQTQPEKVIRADWAFDFALDEPDFEQSHFLTRAQKESTFGSSGYVETFTWGRGPLVVRIYDKVAEIDQQSQKVWFFDIWGQREGVWRVEFQVRGERLKAAGIRSLADLTDLQGDLLRELSSAHTTLRRPTSDSNKSRWPLHPMWEALQREIRTYGQAGLIRAYDEPAFIEYRLDKFAQSLLGNLKGIAALLHLSKPANPDIPDLEVTLKAIPILVQRYHSDRMWQLDVDQRLRDYEAGRW